MMAGATSATAAAGAFAAGAKARGSNSAACPRLVPAGGRRRCGVVRCDAGGDAQAVAKAASIAALEQFKISADRESLSFPLQRPSSNFASPSPGM
jgi:glutamyl-tRNA reductase